MKIERDDFTFEGLWKPAGKKEVVPLPPDSLCYLIGLVDSPSHAISVPLPAKRILSWLYEVEEQCDSAAHLNGREEFYRRYFPGGYKAITPCMVVKQWSPVAALLDRGMFPLVLNREEQLNAVATGIWEPVAPPEVPDMRLTHTGEELFWAIWWNASIEASKHGMQVSLLARVGWSYTHAIGSLPKWTEDEVVKSGRILWKRTPEG